MRACVSDSLALPHLHPSSFYESATSDSHNGRVTFAPVTSRGDLSLYPFIAFSSFPLHAPRAPGMKSPQRTIRFRVPFIGSSVLARVYHADSADLAKLVSSPRFANPAGLYICMYPCPSLPSLSSSLPFSSALGSFENACHHSTRFSTFRAILSFGAHAIPGPHVARDYGAGLPGWRMAPQDLSAVSQCRVNASARQPTMKTRPSLKSIPRALRQGLWSATCPVLQPCCLDGGCQHLLASILTFHVIYEDA